MTTIIFPLRGSKTQRALRWLSHDSATKYWFWCSLRLCVSAREYCFYGTAKYLWLPRNETSLALRTRF